jgi:hypothetical protein
MAMYPQELQSVGEDSQKRCLLYNPRTIRVRKHEGVGVLRRDEINVPRTAGSRILLEERMGGRRFIGH